MANVKQEPVSGLDYITVGATENPKNILVILHGSGADHSDMEGVSKFFAKKLPDTLIVIPNGPFLFADILPPEQGKQLVESGMDIEKMRSWFDAAKTEEGMTQRQAADAMMVKMRETSDKLHKFIAEKQKEHGLKDGNTAVYGFSQGGVLALLSGVERYPSPVAAVVSHSGYMLGLESGFSKPRTLLIVGSQEMQDEQPMKEMHAETAEFLRDTLGVNVKEHVSPGLGHGLNMDTINAATSFIKKAFEGPSAAIDLSATFSKFAGAEVPVRELIDEKDDDKKVLWVSVLDKNSALMKEFQQAAHDAGFRDVRILTPTTSPTTDEVHDRLTASITKGADGKYRLGGFKAG